ncbi:MAG TPA: acriflavin resistance protein [Gammaproteobacteria bacterium]|nr:acriflavin resistance protein [Gammaproteobacteria bacterium]
MIDTNTGLIAWFARNHVAANLLMVVIVMTGLFAATTIRTQMFPDLEIDRVTISVPFPGASPGEVESGVVTRLEEALRDIEGIAEMRSFSSEGSGRVVLDLEVGYYVPAILDEVKLAVDRISSFPESIEKPVISKSQRQIPAINVQIYGDLDEVSMKNYAEQIRDDILALPSVTKAEVRGARPFEISIEMEEVQLRQYGLTLRNVADAIRQSSLDLPAGSIRSDSGDILLRTEGQAYFKQDFEKIVLITRSDGTRLMLGDIATINDGFEEVEFYSLFNGQPTIGVQVSAVGDQNQINISKEVEEYIEELRISLPDGVQVESWMNATTLLEETRSMMLGNMAMGVLLVLVVLGLFLRLQLAFWVMLGMPIAFLGAFALMPLVGGSLNVLSIFGFILVLGIVVDDAIIIGESVQTATENDGLNLDSVIRGARKVAMPATFGVLTTVAAFVPFLTVPGSFGPIPFAIGSVVILCLLFSIVESKLILPAHLASMKPIPYDANHAIRKFQAYFATRLKHVIENIYEPFLTRCLEVRYTTISVFLAMLILALGLVLSPYIRTVFFPNMSSDFVRVQVEMIEGTASAQTVRIAEHIHQALLDLDKSKPEKEKFLRNVASYTWGSNASVMGELKTVDSLNIAPETIVAEWRERIGDVAGVKTMNMAGWQKSHGQGKDLGFRLVSGNREQLAGAAQMLEEQLKAYAGVYEIENSEKGSIPELNLRIKPSAEALGLTLADLASQVRAAFYGVEVQRVQRGREEVKVMVRYPQEERESIGNLESMYIRTASGDEVPFTAVAEVDQRETPSVIYRAWGKRSVYISADVDKATMDPGRIVREISGSDFVARLKAQYPSVNIELGGASLEEQELIQRMIFTAALALFGIYALMAIPLKSYTQPLIIMGVIPFGMIGALIGHILVGIPFSALSVYGIIALAGVVVNDSIILVDYVNKANVDGRPIFEAVIESGKQRFRAIMLTSLTTFFGLLPILLETSLSAEFVTPMAVSLGFGILFATVITLILIPCLYLVLNDLKLARHQFSPDF